MVQIPDGRSRPTPPRRASPVVDPERALRAGWATARNVNARPELLPGGVPLRRRVGVLAVGIVVSLVLATAAYATNSIEIKSGKVPGGASNKLVVNVTYSCDPSSGIEKLLVKALDEDRKAEGTGEGTIKCDGASHPADVTVESPTPFHKGDAIDVAASFADSGGKTVGDAQEAKPLYAE